MIKLERNVLAKVVRSSAMATALTVASTASDAAEPMRLEVTIDGFADGAQAVVDVWGKDLNEDGFLSSVPNDPALLDSTANMLTAGDEIWRIEVRFTGNSEAQAFDAVWDRVNYQNFDNYLTSFSHFAFDLEGGLILGDQESEGMVVGESTRVGSIAVGQKGLAINGFNCDTVGPGPGNPCGMVQVFTQFEPFDPFASQLSFGDGTATVRRVVRQLFNIRPGNNDNGVFTNGISSFWVSVQGSDGIDAADIDPTTFSAGRGHAKALSWYRWDSNGDGITELWMRYSMRETGVVCGDEYLSFEGATFNGTFKIIGEDRVNPVDCPQSAQ